MRDECYINLTEKKSDYYNIALQAKMCSPSTEKVIIYL